MVQVKKSKGREAILNAATELFVSNGYHAATLREISRKAGMSLANVYVYFDSKYDILFAINDPWIRSWFDLLEKDALLIADPRKRLRQIVTTIWRDIPAAHNGFARNIMQALSEARPDRQYDPTMIRWIEAKLNGLLLSCMPPERRRLLADGSVAHIMMMAFDGFAINQPLNPDASCSAGMIDVICELLLPASESKPRSRNAVAAKAPAKTAAKKPAKRKAAPSA